MVIYTKNIAGIIDSIREILKESYLLSYSNATHVVLFRPDKHDEIKDLLSELAVHHEGCCFYFKDFSVALWQDVEDAIGFQGESVCCVEFFEKEINRNFHWRKGSPVVQNQKGDIMQISFRIECPHCHWGHIFKDSYINMGYLKGKCEHCGEAFFFKITVTGVDVEINRELPQGLPCVTLPEAKEALDEI
jgi:hypothetical protein